MGPRFQKPKHVVKTHISETKMTKLFVHTPLALELNTLLNPLGWQDSTPIAVTLSSASSHHVLRDATRCPVHAVCLGPLGSLGFPALLACLTTLRGDSWGSMGESFEWVHFVEDAPFRHQVTSTWGAMIACQSSFTKASRAVIYKAKLQNPPMASRLA